MLMLGDLLARAEAAAPAFEAWLEAARPELARQVAAAAGPEGAGGFARRTVAAFDRHADEAAWARLTSRMRDAEDPGLACLEEMVRWRLAAEPTGASR